MHACKWGFWLAVVYTLSKVVYFLCEQTIVSPQHTHTMLTCSTQLEFCHVLLLWINNKLC